MPLPPVGLSLLGVHGAGNEHATDRFSPGTYLLVDPVAAMEFVAPACATIEEITGLVSTILGADALTGDSWLTGDLRARAAPDGS